MGIIRRKLTVNEGIQLMNLLIKQTNLQCDVIEFQQARNLDNYGFKYGEVGKGWWQGFLKKNVDKIVTMWGEKFATNRLD